MRRRWLAGSAKRQSCPAFTPGQCTPKSERHAARTAATCADGGLLLAVAAGPGGGGAAGSAAAAGGSAVAGGGGGAAAAGGGGGGAAARWCRLRRRRALCRRRSNGVERRLARRRYFGGIALETFERVFGARLHAGALRHEVGAAGGADRRNLLGRRLLGRGRQRSPNHEPGRDQQAHSAPTAELHASLPFCRRGTLHNRASAVQHAVYCRSASALRLPD